MTAGLVFISVLPKDLVQVEAFKGAQPCFYYLVTQQSPVMSLELLEGVALTSCARVSAQLS